MEERTYTLSNVHTAECIHGKVYNTPNGTINTEETYTSRNKHTEEHIHGDDTHGGVIQMA